MWPTKDQTNVTTHRTGAQLTANRSQYHGAQYDADGDDEYVVREVFGVLGAGRVVVRSVQERLEAGRHVGRHVGQRGGRGRAVAGVVVVAVDVVDGHRPDGPEVVADTAAAAGAGGQQAGRHVQVIVGHGVAVVVRDGVRARATAAGHVALAAGPAAAVQR